VHPESGEQKRIRPDLVTNSLCKTLVPLVAVAVLLVACAGGRQPAPAPVPQPVAMPLPERGAVPTPRPLPPAAWRTLEQALGARLSVAAIACSDAWIDTHALARFYDASGGAPLWVSEHGANGRAYELLATLRRADREGLPARRYRVNEIERHWYARAPAEQACLELLLTDAYQRYASDVHTGLLNPREADPSWHLAPPTFDPAARLIKAKGHDRFSDLLDALAPPQPAYRRLRDALARYRHIARAGGWAPLDAGPALAPGQRHLQVIALRERLRAEGDLAPGWFAGGDLYDAKLERAVRHFQRRHGLTDDGIIGPQTRDALNVPVDERIAQLRRSMERWRWLPRSLGEHYVWVNTAGFEVSVVEGGRTVLAMRAIVGTPDQATPSFRATFRSLVINPYWNVPTRIVRDKLVPRQQADPQYLASRGFRVLTERNGRVQALDPSQVAWAKVDAATFSDRLRQEPGPKNSMGRLAFDMPNRFDIFLHDTPQRYLFKHDVRTYSEGCVRIDQAMALAVHTLRRDAKWDQAQLREAIDSLKYRKLALPEAIPVYVVYLPSWVDEQGVVHFVDDVYQREGVLASWYPAADGSR